MPRRDPSPVGRILVLLVCGAVTALVACSNKTQETINQREYAQYRGGGSATISGQVTMTLPSGAVMNGSACQVRLMPITTATTSYIQGTVMTGGTKPPKPAADAVWWLEQADQEGRFKFLAVPAGSYYLVCPVAWRDPGSGEARQRILWAETTVGPQDSVTVSVSR
jgi:hypothetical protein